MRPVVEQLDALVARKEKGLETARDALREGRQRLSVITSGLEKLKISKEFLNERAIVEQLLRAAVEKGSIRSEQMDAQMDDLGNGFRVIVEQLLRAAVEKGSITASEMDDVSSGFQKLDRLEKGLSEQYSKNRYVRPHWRSLLEIFRTIPSWFGIGLVVFFLGGILSIFTGLFTGLDGYIVVCALGCVLYPPGRFAVEKFRQKIQLDEIDALRGIIRGKVARLVDPVERKTQQQMAALDRGDQSTTDSLQREYTEGLRELENRARHFLKNFKDALSAKEHSAGILAGDWFTAGWSTWSPAGGSPGVLRIGTLSTENLANSLRPTFPEVDFLVELPALAKFPSGGRICQRGIEQRAEAVGLLQSITARLLATIPPGKLRFTFIDPVGLGQNVAAFMALGDYDESLINSRAWSEPEHIDKRLKELTEHVENVIQKYLRHEFKTIEDYNRQAHEVAEPYRVLVVFDFPVNFTEASARRLVSLVQNGPRCGVYPILLQDTSKPLPYGFSIDDVIEADFVWNKPPGDDFTFERDCPCPPELLSRIIKEVGEAAKENMTVVVPYAKVLALAGLAPEHPAGWWKVGGAADAKEESSSASVDIPLGPTGARKAQFLTLGKGTAHHALIAGRTGSGKSNLLHVIVTTLALKYSPREVELYLIDFKKGVEFKSYANHALPHARVIAIESEREFGLSVLQGLDAEMQRRGEAFRKVAANDLAEYREKTATQLPRLILIVDEFQEFFSEDDAIGRQAAGILDRLVRQGRSFGIHLLLGSQSLAGSYTLARSTLDQMQIRIALPYSEADSRLILADDNPAARLLARPGEAIYNAASGLVEGNQVFQVALFSDDDREHYLRAIADKGAGEKRQPLVFEGHEPAALEACAPLAQLLAAPDWPVSGKAAEVWLGEPVAMKAPTSVRFRRQGGANLLIVTREEEEGVGLLSACMLGLAAQHRPGTAQLYILNLCTADTPWEGFADELEDALSPSPLTIHVVRKQRDIPALLADLAAEIQRRIDGEQSAKAWSGYLVIQGLHRARGLRSDPAQGYSFGEEAAKVSPAEQFATILREGPEVGIHTLLWCDTYLNLERTLETRALREFGHRVAGTMSQDDSMRLLDDAAAARLDRPHRLIKYDEDQVGMLEKFRPYRIPATAWLERTAETLRGR